MQYHAKGYTIEPRCVVGHAVRQNPLTTHFSERIPVVKRRVSVYACVCVCMYIYELCTYIYCHIWH